jgi:L-serine dehydratase
VRSDWWSGSGALYRTQRSRGGKAIAAAKFALRGDGERVVSLDQAIEAMRKTGLGMSDRYKETARGGLAVSVPNC